VCVRRRDGRGISGWFIGRENGGWRDGMERRWGCHVRGGERGRVYSGLGWDLYIGRDIRTSNTNSFSSDYTAF
jgi:hypothetical protein